MASFLRELAAAPIVLLFYLCGLLKHSFQMTCAKWIWTITGQLEWARLWIYLAAQKQGMEKAGIIAEEIIRTTGDARIPAAMGIMEYYSHQNHQAAHYWVQKGETACPHHQEFLLYLKMMLSEQYPQYDSETIVQQLLSRNDLPMDQTRSALFVHLHHVLYKKDWALAALVIERIIAIEEIPVLYCYRWIILMADGRREEAQQQLLKAENKIPKYEMFHCQAMGMYLMNRIQDARDYLKAAVQEGLDIQRLRYHQPELAELLSEPDSKPAS